MKPKKKKRSHKYEEKLHVDGSFLDLVKIAVSPKEIERNMAKKSAPKKK